MWTKISLNGVLQLRKMQPQKNRQSKTATRKKCCLLYTSGMACCPFHDDKNPSMKVDQRFHCFGCGADGEDVYKRQAMTQPKSDLAYLRSEKAKAEQQLRYYKHRENCLLYTSTQSMPSGDMMICLSCRNIGRWW